MGIFESDFDCLTDVILMPSYLGKFARASLKAAVINAENRNRLNEEDRCWRSHADARSKSKKENKYDLKSDKSRKRKEARNSEPAEEPAEISNIQKWGHDGAVFTL